MKKINEILSISALLLFGVASVWGQESHNLTGKILSNKNKPVEGAIVTVMDTMNVTTTKDGTFQFSLKDPSKAKEISVWAPGYFSVKQLVNDRQRIIIMMTPEDRYKYNEIDDTSFPS